MCAHLGKRLWGVFIKSYRDEQQLVLSVSPRRRGSEREREQLGLLILSQFSTLLEKVLVGNAFLKKHLCPLTELDPFSPLHVGLGAPSWDLTFGGFFVVVVLFAKPPLELRGWKTLTLRSRLHVCPTLVSTRTQAFHLTSSKGTWPSLALMVRDT